jgi:hypothetical protein
MTWGQVQHIGNASSGVRVSPTRRGQREGEFNVPRWSRWHEGEFNASGTMWRQLQRVWDDPDGIRAWAQFQRVWDAPEGTNAILTCRRSGTFHRVWTRFQHVWDDPEGMNKITTLQGHSRTQESELRWVKCIWDTVYLFLVFSTAVIVSIFRLTTLIRTAVWPAGRHIGPIWYPTGSSAQPTGNSAQPTGTSAYIL